MGPRHLAQRTRCDSTFQAPAETAGPPSPPTAPLKGGLQARRPDGRTPSPACDTRSAALPPAGAGDRPGVGRRVQPPRSPTTPRISSASSLSGPSATLAGRAPSPPLPGHRPHDPAPGRGSCAEGTSGTRTPQAWEASQGGAAVQGAGSIWKEAAKEGPCGAGRTCPSRRPLSNFREEECPALPAPQPFRASRAPFPSDVAARRRTPRSRCGGRGAGRPRAGSSGWGKVSLRAGPRPPAVPVGPGPQTEKDAPGGAPRARPPQTAPTLAKSLGITKSLWKPGGRENRTDPHDLGPRAGPAVLGPAPGGNSAPGVGRAEGEGAPPGPAPGRLLPPQQDREGQCGRPWEATGGSSLESFGVASGPAWTRARLSLAVCHRLRGGCRSSALIRGRHNLQASCGPSSSPHLPEPGRLQKTQESCRAAGPGRAWATGGIPVPRGREWARARWWRRSPPPGPSAPPSFYPEKSGEFASSEPTRAPRQPEP